MKLFLNDAMSHFYRYLAEWPRDREEYLANHPDSGEMLFHEYFWDRFRDDLSGVQGIDLQHYHALADKCLSMLHKMGKVRYEDGFIYWVERK